MLFTMPMNKLALISALGGVIGLTTVFSVRNNFTQKVSKQTFYLEAVERLKKHQGAKFILGTPIIIKERCRIVLEKSFS
jgi:hypothetical protein